MTGNGSPAEQRVWAAQDDRFVRPAAADPRQVAAVEGRLWQLLPDDVVGVELSPVAPLGTVSCLATERLTSLAGRGGERLS